jgi:predicted metal-dependent phosphoesterase TrpH
LNVDLHCHSTVSDGFLRPAEVVRRAARNGVDLLALTDHDELGGLAEAREAAAGFGLRLIDGVEISVSWGNETVHIVGLGFNPEAPGLRAGLAKVRAGREGRAVRMGAELERVGIRGALEGARRLATNPALVSRAHFARHLVQSGLMPNVQTVFQHYLVRGKPGFVEHEWASLEEAVGWIRGAGGLAVVAHPARCRLPEAGLRTLFERFKELGGAAIEVVSGAHDEDSIRRFARVARHYGFLASRASDFHGELESPVDLGRAPPLPPDLTPVWEHFP